LFSFLFPGISCEILQVILGVDEWGGLMIKPRSHFMLKSSFTSREVTFNLFSVQHTESCPLTELFLRLNWIVCTAWYFGHSRHSTNVPYPSKHWLKHSLP
jgi:hypothetical protein